ERCRRDGKPAVVRDAHLDLRAAVVVAQQPRPRRTVRTREDLDAPSGEADARAVEALDDCFLGRPPTGQPLLVARAVSKLGWGVNLVQEAGTGALHGNGDSINRDGVDADPLHELILRLSAQRSPHPAASPPTSPASGEVNSRRSIRR